MDFHALTYNVDILNMLLKMVLISATDASSGHSVETECVMYLIHIYFYSTIRVFFYFGHQQILR